MDQGDYVAPKFLEDAFCCPHCNAFSHQSWPSVYYSVSSGGFLELDDLAISICARCERFSYWIKGRLIFPQQITAPLPHGDMPKSVLEYYNEAREVSVSSPRAAAALLRIAAKKLCEDLGEDESNLNQAIGNLNKKGLPETVIMSLDTVRIVGNEGGAHEGQIDLTGKDNEEIVNRLFWLINFIVQKTITEPAKIEETFFSLPEDKKKGVAIRDDKR